MTAHERDNVADFDDFESDKAAESAALLRVKAVSLYLSMNGSQMWVYEK